MSGLVVLTCGCGAKLLDEDREPGWRCPECAGSSRLWNDGYDRGLRDAIDLVETSATLGSPNTALEIALRKLLANRRENA